MEGETSSSPNSGDGVMAEFAVSAFEFDFFHLKAFPFDDHILTAGTKRIFCFMPGDIADIDIMQAFAESDLSDLF